MGTDVSPWPPSSVSLFKKLDSTLFSSRFLPLPLVPQKPAVPLTDGSSQEMPMDGLESSTMNTTQVTLVSTPSDSSPLMPKNLLKCKPRNFNTDVLLCLPQPVSSPKSSLTKHPLLKTSSNKH